jgi:large subunit ribosomal protein L6
MSRAGKRPIPIPQGVTVKVDGGSVSAKGPKGELRRELKGPVTVKVVEGARQVVVGRTREDRYGREQHGLWRALIAGMIDGVSNGVTKVLEVIGVGYRGEVKGKTLVLNLGYASPVECPIPDGVKVEVTRATRPGIDGEIHVTGIDKEAVGQFAATVRRTRDPDPYKGKGVRYRGEYIRKLAGKTFGSAG